MRRIGLERQIAELVDDQQFRFAKVGETILEPALAMGLGELGYQGRRLSEQHGIACKDRLAPDRHCQMRLADPGRPQQQHRLGIGDEAPGRDLADLLLVDRGLGGEVEADDAVEVDRVDNTLEPAGPAMVNRDLPPGMADAEQIAGDYHAHGFTDQPPRHRIGIAIDLNDAISLHLAHQLTRHLKRRNLSDRAQSASLGAPKALNRRLAGRAVHPLIGDLARPSVEMGFQCRPALELPSSNGVLLDIADATLVLPLGARPVGGTGARPKTPMLGERVKPGIELDFPSHPVVTSDQPAIIVEEQAAMAPAHSTNSSAIVGMRAMLQWSRS